MIPGRFDYHAPSTLDEAVALLGEHSGPAPALFEEIVYDQNGQNPTGTFADYLLPTEVESPSHLGVKHLEIPVTPEKVWKALREAGVPASAGKRPEIAAADLERAPTHWRTAGREISC